MCGVKEMITLLDLCVSYLRSGHANILCIVPMVTDDPRRESTWQGCRKKRPRPKVQGSLRHSVVAALIIIASRILDDRSSPLRALELPGASGRASDDVSLAKPTFGGRRQ